MAMIGAAIEVGHHADHLRALHLGIQRASHAVIGAGRRDAALRPAHLDDGFSISAAVGQTATQVPQDTHSDDMKSSPPAAAMRLSNPHSVGQGIGALDVGTGAHAARADNAF
jgi:hypothetical protein